MIQTILSCDQRYKDGCPNLDIILAYCRLRPVLSRDVGEWLVKGLSSTAIVENIDIAIHRALQELDEVLEQVERKKTSIGNLRTRLVQIAQRGVPHESQ